MELQRRLLMEPVPIDDDLCTDLEMIEDLEWAVRLVWAAQQTLYETGEPVLVVKRKIVLPYAVFGPVVDKTRSFLNRRAARRGGGGFLHLVT